MYNINNIVTKETVFLCLICFIISQLLFLNSDLHGQKYRETQFYAVYLKIVISREGHQVR